MEDWLQRLWKKRPGTFVGGVALLLLILGAILGAISLFSDTGFAKEVEAYRWLILGCALAAASLVTAGMLLWRWSPSRWFLNRLRLSAMKVVLSMRNVWQLVLGLIMLVISMCAVYLWMRTLWAVAITLGLVLATLLLARYHRKLDKVEITDHNNFSEDFSHSDLPNWKYSGEWCVQAEGEDRFLIVTHSLSLDKARNAGQMPG
jgi:MFS family permease